MELPDVVQHKVEVLQSRHERALYLQQERDSGKASNILCLGWKKSYGFDLFFLYYLYNDIFFVCGVGREIWERLSLQFLKTSKNHLRIPQLTFGISCKNR